MSFCKPLLSYLVPPIPHDLRFRHVSGKRNDVRVDIDAGWGEIEDGGLRLDHREAPMSLRAQLRQTAEACPAKDAGHKAAV